MEELLINHRLKDHDVKFDLFERRHEESKKNDHAIRSVLTKDAHSIEKLFEICEQNVKNLTHLSDSMFVIKNDVNDLKNDKKIEQGVHDRFFKYIQVGKICTPIFIFILVLLAGFDSYMIRENSQTLHKNGMRVKAIASDITK